MHERQIRPHKIIANREGFSFFNPRRWWYIRLAMARQRAEKQGVFTNLTVYERGKASRQKKNHEKR